MPDSLTTLGTGLVVLGSKDILTKMLGPSAEYIGEVTKGLVEKCNINLDNIFSKAKRRLGNKIEDPGIVNPRVLKHVLDEGRFCEDELTAEYYGGLLASSRTKEGRDDRASRSLNVLKKNKKGLLTEYQRSFSFWKKSSATGRCCASYKILILHDKIATLRSFQHVKRSARRQGGYLFIYDKADIFLST